MYQCNLINLTDDNSNPRNNSDNENSDCDNEFYRVLSGDTNFEESTHTDIINNTNSILASVQALSYLESKKKRFKRIKLFSYCKKIIFEI